MKIRVSFQDEQGLDRVLELLKPIVISYKVSKSDAGQFKRAYIEVRETEK